MARLASFPGLPTIQFLIACSMQTYILQAIKNWTVRSPGNEAMARPLPFDILNCSWKGKGEMALFQPFVHALNYHWFQHVCEGANDTKRMINCTCFILVCYVHIISPSTVARSLHEFICSILNIWHHVNIKITSGTAIRGEGGVAAEGKLVGIPNLHSWSKCTMHAINEYPVRLGFLWSVY